LHLLFQDPAGGSQGLGENRFPVADALRDGVQVGCGDGEALTHRSVPPDDPQHRPSGVMIPHEARIRVAEDGGQKGVSEVRVYVKRVSVR
jgi:hypothetical protein